MHSTLMEVSQDVIQLKEQVAQDKLERDLMKQEIDQLKEQLADIIADKKKTQKKEKKDKKKSKDTDDDEPKKKKGPTGYLLYSKAIRPEAVEKLSEESDDKPKPTDVTKKIGAMWKSLSDDERDAWIEKAKELKTAA